MQWNRHGLERMAIVLGIWLGCAGPSPAVEPVHKLKGAVFSPMPGVLCDKRGGFCADTQGVAVALTRLYLGDKAEARLMQMIEGESGGANFDPSTFVLTNNVACDCKARKCTVSKHLSQVDAAHTKALFGQ